MLLLALALSVAAADLADRPAIARLRTIDLAVLDVRSDRAGWWVASQGAGAHATIDGEVEHGTDCRAPESGALSPDLVRAASVDVRGRVCVAGGPLAPKAPVRLLGGQGWRAVVLPDASTVVRARADGSLEALGDDGGRLWRRRAPVGAFRQLRRGASAREVLLVGDAGAALIDVASGRLVRAMFVQGATSAVAEGEDVWIGDAGGGVWRVDRTRWTREAFRPEGADPSRESAVRDLDVMGRHLAVLGDDGRLWVQDLRRRQRALDTRVDATRVRWSRESTKEIRAAELVVIGTSRAEVWRAPDLDAVPSRAPESEAPLHRPLTRRVPDTLLAELVDLAELPRLADQHDAAAPTLPLAPGVVPLALGRTGVLGRTADGALAWWRPTQGDAGGGTPPATGVASVLPGSAGATVLSLEGDRVLAVNIDAALGTELTMWDGPIPVVRIPWKPGAPPPVAGETAGRVVVARDRGGGAWAGAGPLSSLSAPGGVTSVAGDSRRGRVALGRADGTVEVRAARSGADTPSRSTQILPRAVTALAWSGQTVAAASAAPVTMIAGNDGAGGTVGLLQQDEAPAGEGFATAGVPDVLQLDGTHVLARWGGGMAVHARDGSARLQLEEPLLDARLDGERVRTLDAAGRVRTRSLSPTGLPRVPRATNVVRSPDGRRAATIEGDVVTLWDGRAARVLDVLPPLGAAAVALAFRGDVTGADDLLAVLRDDATIDLFDAARGEHRGALDVGGSTADSSALFFGAGGDVLWTAANLADGPAVLGWRLGVSGLAGAPDIVIAGVLAPDAGARDAGERFRALRDGRWLDTSDGHLIAGADSGVPLAVSPDGTQRARGRAGQIQREHAGTGGTEGPALRARAPRGTPSPTPRAAAWSEDGKLLAVAWSDDTLRVHDLHWGTELRRIPTDVTLEGAAGAAIHALVFDADDPGVVMARDGAGRRRVFAWKLDRERPAPPSEPGGVTRVAGAGALAGDPARGRVLTGHDDGTIRAWDTATGTQVALLTGHAGPVRGLRVVGDRLFSLGGDGTLRAWDATTGAERGAVSTFGVPLVAWLEAPSSAAEGTLRALGADGHPRTWRWTGARFDDARVEGDVLAVDHPPLEWHDASTRWVLGVDGKLRVWSTADAQADRRLGTLTPLSDGSWVLDRGDGTRLASPSLRDGSAPSLRH